VKKILRLEALPAKHGDTLLLHYGPADSPKLILVDGGPRGVYRRTLGPRLRALRQERGLRDGDPLAIRLAMVSHLDADHISGILDLTDELIEHLDDDRPLPYRIGTLWHNAFDDIVGNAGEAIFQAAIAGVGAASVTADVPADVRGRHPGAALLASVPQGRELRDNTAKLGLEVNEGATGLLARDGDGAGPTLSLGHGLRFRVLGPSQDRIERLQKEWDDHLVEGGLADEAKAAAFVDSSVFNLASVVVLAEMGKRKLLLTGDARGDHILEALRESKALPGEPYHVDLLKLPHHGSERNVTTDFFRSVTADHYVISADGRFGNPELSTLEMIFDAREGSDFALHFTYPMDEMDQGKEIERLFTRMRRKGRSFEAHTPESSEHSITVDLAP
jgi:hypothetical protein